MINRCGLAFYPMNLWFRFTLLNAFRAVAILGSVALFAAPAGAESTERAARVEAGLVPRLLIEGQPIKWALKDRMAHYRVPGVSIAVINDGKLEWARG